jgi:hypothetical protein
MEIFINFIVPHVKTKGNLYHDHHMVCKISAKLLPHGGALAKPN